MRVIWLARVRMPGTYMRATLETRQSCLCRKLGLPSFGRTTAASGARAMAAVSDETKATLLEVFSMLDRSGTTQIDMREVGYLLNKLCGRNLDEMVLSEIMSEVCDSDAPGQGIDFDSFCAALGPILGESEEELNKRAFSAMCVPCPAGLPGSPTCFDFARARVAD